MDKFDSVHLIFFSPTHTSEKVARAVAEGTHLQPTIVTDLTTDESTEPIEVAANTLAVIAAPVYVGRVAPTALQRLRRLRGHNTRAIVLAVYGNRDYEDALLELYNETIDLGFVPIGAGAFIGEHSYSRPETPIAAGRPDGFDEFIANGFGRYCVEKWGTTCPPGRLFVKGNTPYRQVPPSPPSAPVCNDACLVCGECIEACPTHAITLSSEGKIETDAARCIKCCACVKECPQGARLYNTPFSAALHKLCTTRREAELFA